MTPQPALPMSPDERARLRARHLADQAAAARRNRSHGNTAAGILAVAVLLVLVFVGAGIYSVAAAHGVVPAAPWSALAP